MNGHTAKGGGAKIQNCPINLTLNFNITIKGKPDQEQESGLVQSIIGAVRRAIGSDTHAITFQAQGVPIRELQGIEHKRLED